MAHTFMQKVHQAASTVGHVAGTGLAVYNAGKAIWGIGRALAPLAAMAL